MTDLYLLTKEPSVLVKKVRVTELKETTLLVPYTAQDPFNSFERHQKKAVKHLAD